MSIDPARIYSALQNTGLQRKDNPLYQVIRDLIGAVSSIDQQVTVNTGGSSSTINNITQVINPFSEDGISSFDDSSSIPGVTGPQGIQGIRGIPGSDGIDNIEDNIYFGNSGSSLGGIFIKGSVIFAGPSGNLAQDNANFFWDDANNRLGIGTNTPLDSLQIIKTYTNTGNNGTISIEPLINAGLNCINGSKVLYID